MIVPTRGAAMLAGAGVPVALVVAVMVPGRWYLALAWPGAVLVATLADALLGPRRGDAVVRLPSTLAVGETLHLPVEVTIAGARGRAEVAVSADPLLEWTDDGRAGVALVAGRGTATIDATARRRGTARIDTLWLRWRGRLGLAWHQRRIAVARALPILPDLRLVHQRGPRLFQRHALQGLLAQAGRGDGGEFESLVEYQPGMDRRAIDWKQSARHVALHAKHHQPERNAQLVFAIDCARSMGDPVAGVPRLDRAVSAALLVAWVALKLGDRVALDAFDARPRLHTGFVGGVRSFATLQHRAAAIDYGVEEANYAYALGDLGARLSRRSTVLLFTEFADTIAADALIRGAGRLVRAHLLVVVVLRDEEVEGIVDSAPASAADVTRAITAAGLLRDRLLVLARLRHLGAHVVEAEHDRVGERLVEVYVDLKRRGLA